LWEAPCWWEARGPLGPPPLNPALPTIKSSIGLDDKWIMAEDFDCMNVSRYLPRGKMEHESSERFVWTQALPAAAAAAGSARILRYVSGRGNDCGVAEWSEVFGC